MVAGLVAVVLPLAVVSAWLVPLAWVGWVLLLEPLNYRGGYRSWLADLARGDASTLAALLVPYGPHVKLFEMPLLGYLGFPPFALECYAIFHRVRGLLGSSRATPVI